MRSQWFADSENGFVIGGRAESNNAITTRTISLTALPTSPILGTTPLPSSPQTTSTIASMPGLAFVVCVLAGSRACVPETDGPSRRGPCRQRFGEAANLNQSIRDFRQAAEWWSECWREEAITSNPPMRVEFEHAIAFSTFSEALSLRRNKSGWGKLVGIEPLRPDDVLHPCRIVYQLKSSSKM